jgi:hypothetical protein
MRGTQVLVGDHGRVDGVLAGKQCDVAAGQVLPDATKDFCFNFYLIFPIFKLCKLRGFIN